ncbi:hypothetical protein AVEN_216933-1 [Araneus ventricosus]|uniref:Uncharacterized protein n=1 Tax=Araneus ventricosus TaxID=182803 RepID=A0A4Y2UIC6_ARAVE|nr:hypothetical protein AVEN_24907-1 [Araneus ventricosus]GBO11942.1 hypothetical protein AVEN_216933-1 [Araneus ventricosus]
MPRTCKNHPNSFCYVCGQLTFKKQRKHLTPLVKNFYALYFGFSNGDQDKSWAPHIACKSCCSNMTSWLKGSRHMPFAIPMIWKRNKRPFYRLLFSFDRYFINRVAFEAYSRVSKSSISNQDCTPWFGTTYIETTGNLESR